MWMEEEEEMKALSIKEMEQAMKYVLSLDKQKQFLEDRKSAYADDTRNGRGYLAINPDSDLRDKDIHGLVIEHGGKEYRVVVDEMLRGMKDKTTGETITGWWIAPMSDLPPLVMRDMKKKP